MTDLLDKDFNYLQDAHRKQCLNRVGSIDIEKWIRSPKGTQKKKSGT
jgi:hypothetical protein